MGQTNKRLVGPALVATGPTTVYTVPAATVAVIQNLNISNPSASAVTFTLSIGADAAGTRLYSTYSIGAGVVLNLFVKWVMTAAEILTVSAGTNNILNLTVNGFESTPG